MLSRVVHKSSSATPSSSSWGIWGIPGQLGLVIPHTNSGIVPVSSPSLGFFYRKIYKRHPDQILNHINWLLSTWRSSCYSKLIPFHQPKIKATSEGWNVDWKDWELRLQHPNYCRCTNRPVNLIKIQVMVAEAYAKCPLSTTTTSQSPPWKIPRCSPASWDR